MSLALSSVIVTSAALLPERFRGGCAFGGGDPGSNRRRSLPRGSIDLSDSARLSWGVGVGFICPEQYAQVKEQLGFGCGA